MRDRSVRRGRSRFHVDMDSGRLCLASRLCVRHHGRGQTGPADLSQGRRPAGDPTIFDSEDAARQGAEMAQNAPGLTSSRSTASKCERNRSRLSLKRLPVRTMIQEHEMFRHCRGSPLPRAMFPPPSIPPRTASIPRSSLRSARLPVSFAVRLRMSKPSSPASLATLSFRTLWSSLLLTRNASMPLP